MKLDTKAFTTLERLRKASDLSAEEFGMVTLLGSITYTPEDEVYGEFCKYVNNEDKSRKMHVKLDKERKIVNENK